MTGTTHKQGGCDCLEHIVDGIGKLISRRIGLSDKVRELGVRLARAVARSTSYDLNDFGEGTAIAHRQRVLAVNPVKSPPWPWATISTTNHVTTIHLIFAAPAKPGRADASV